MSTSLCHTRLLGKADQNWLVPSKELLDLLSNTAPPVILRQRLVHFYLPQKRLQNQWLFRKTDTSSVLCS